MKRITVNAESHEDIVDITEEVREFVQEEQIENGVVHISVISNTSALLKGINNDWNYAKDLFDKFNALLPKYNGMLFTGKNTISIKAGLLGTTETIVVEKNELILAKNQSIYLVEFKEPGDRQVILTTL